MTDDNEELDDIDNDDLIGEIARNERRLAELRALRERVKHRRLEDADWAVVKALASNAIEQAEPGQQWVSLELTEEEQASDSPTGTAVGVEDSTPEHRRR